MGNPRVIGDIQPFAELARHGPVVVYKGYQSAQDRFVLLKVLEATPTQEKARLEAFAQEATMLARVEHPQVVSIYDFGEAEAGAYIVAEFVDGLDLGQLIARGPLPVELALYIFDACLKGLQAAHQEGVLHRDLKPENIMISFEGQVKLADFGMASLMDADEDAPEVRGTWGYLAPEQILGKPPSAQGDLFALGATLYEMLLGRPAFSGSTPQAVFEALLHHDPMPFLEPVRNIPDALKAMCRTLLEKDPETRFSSCATVADEVWALHVPFRAEAPELKQYLEDREGYLSNRPVSVQRGTSVSVQGRAPVSRSPKKKRTGVRMGVVVLLLITVGGYTMWQVSTAPKPPGPSVTRAEPLPTEPMQDAPEPSVLPNPTEESSPSASEAAQQIPPAALDSVRQDTIAIPLAPSETLPVEQPKEPEAPLPGRLNIICSPWADVTLNGKSIGTTPFAPVALPPGTHTLTLTNPDFPPYETTVTVASDESREFRFSFWSLVGRVTLNVRPWAEVYLNGEYRDTTPQDHPLIVFPGTHRLKLQHPQLGAFETTLVIEAGQTYTLIYNLIELIKS